LAAFDDRCVPSDSKGREGRGLEERMVRPGRGREAVARGVRRGATRGAGGWPIIYKLGAVLG